MLFTIVIFFLINLTIIGTKYGLSRKAIFFVYADAKLCEVMHWSLIHASFWYLEIEALYVWDQWQKIFWPKSKSTNPQVPASTTNDPTQVLNLELELIKALQTASGRVTGNFTPGKPLIGNKASPSHFFF